MSSPAKTLLDVSFGDNVKEDDDEEQDDGLLVEVVDAVDGESKLAASGIPASCVSRKSPLELFFSFFFFIGTKKNCFRLDDIALLVFGIVVARSVLALGTGWFTRGPSGFLNKYEVK